MSGSTTTATFCRSDRPCLAPSTTGVLLNRLKLGSADRTPQSTAIAEWLRDRLIRSLRRRGFGDLVDGGKDPQP
ncbi:hypothetical protein SIM91_02855 [Rhodococcus opacus]|nr:hypothetical protein [Rhodococcus opacus]